MTIKSTPVAPEVKITVASGSGKSQKERFLSAYCLKDAEIQLSSSIKLGLVSTSHILFFGANTKHSGCIPPTIVSP